MSSLSETFANLAPSLQLLIEFPFLLKAINGGVAGIAGHTAVFPLDLIGAKFLNRQIEPNEKHVYNSILHSLKKTCGNEGYLSLYKGSFSKIVFAAPEVGIKLVANEFYRYKINSGYPNKPLPLRQEIMGGVRAGLYQYLLTTPIEQLTRGIMKAWKTASEANLEGQILTKMHAISLVGEYLRTSNPRSLYKGKLGDLLTSVCFCSIYFPIFNHLNCLGPRKRRCPEEAVFWCSFVSGCIGGSLAALCTHPIDVIKSHLRILENSENKNSYRRITDTCVKIFRRAGPKGFFKNASYKMIVVGLLFGVGHTAYYIGVGEYYLDYKKWEVYPSDKNT